MAMSAHQTQAIQECIRNCSTCHDVCLQTLSYCLGKGGPHAEQHHITMLIDCAEICQTSANFMKRGSSLHHATCAACAEVCEKCAQDCARLGNDQAMKQCADECRRCAASCREMAQQR